MSAWSGDERVRSLFSCAASGLGGKKRPSCEINRAGARAASTSASGLARLSRKTLLESVKEMLEISLERVIGGYE